jgi:hypothetical protein
MNKEVSLAEYDDWLRHPNWDVSTPLSGRRSMTIAVLRVCKVNFCSLGI